MEKERIAPETIEEKIVWYSMIWTWGFYVLGALYVVAPVIGWILFAIGFKKLCDELIAGGSISRFGISWTIISWFLGMFVMLIALIIGHLNYNIGLGPIIKSSIGWAKGWALLALFPFIGCLSIRSEVVIRACCVVGMHTVCAVPIFVLAWLVGAPQVLYVSPIQAVGGPGPEFFMVSLYEIDPGSGMPRWRMFTPWAPALGFVANVYMLCALSEKDIRWKAFGIIGAILMILMSQSRLGIVAALVVPFITLGISNISHPLMLAAGGVGAAALGIIMSPLIAAADVVMTKFSEARADSSRVRAALGRIALQRWQSEAPIWGHGVVERGPHMVEYMPIGSHHTWYGLLFVKGLVGLLACLIPMIVGLLELSIKSSRHKEARLGLGMLLLLFLYTFGENLEVLAYLIWPGLLFIGMGAKPSVALRWEKEQKELLAAKQATSVDPAVG